MYRPSDLAITENDQFIDALIRASNNLKNLIIFGDFNFPNIDWTSIAISDNNSSESLFINSYIASNLIQFVDQPTRFRINNVPSMLDLVFSNDRNLINNISYEPPIGISDHATLLVSSQFSIESRTYSKKKIRNFRLANFNAINQYLQTSTISDTNVNSQWLQFMQQFNYSLQFVPDTTKYHNNKPWINSEIKHQINKKRKLWHQFRNSNNKDNFLNYKQCANSLSTQIKHAKTSYEHSLVNRKSSKQFFKHIKSSLDSKIRSFSLHNYDNEITSNPKEVADLFALEFSNSFNIEDTNHLPTLPDHLKNRYTISTIDFTVEKVVAAINKINDDCAPGPDNIHPLYLKNCKLTVAPHLTKIMISSLAEGLLPSDWKKSIVIPVFKSGNKLDPANYRQISLTCLACKCMERIVSEELTDFFLESGVLHPQQHGFLRGRSTVSNLLQCTNDWTQEVDQGNPVDVIYLDFKRAFDKVPHERLLHKLNQFGVKDPLLSWIRNFLSKRTGQVRIEDELSECFDITSGVPQGSVIGPLLFNIFISDIVPLFESKVSLFADDTKFFSNPITSKHQLASDLIKLEEWCLIWQLELNVKKCSVLHLGYHNPNNTYFLNGAPITRVLHQNDLGVIISSDLKWAAHITMTIKKANRVVYMVCQSFKNMSTDLLAKIYKTYIRPILDYAASVWCPYFAKDIHAIEQVQRRVTKLAPAIRDLPYEQRLQALGLSSLQERRLRGDLIETFKILHGHYSTPISMFVISEDVRNRGHRYKLVRERFRKLCRQNFLSNRVFREWNSLPDRVVASPSVNAFKNAIDNLYV